MEKPVSVHLHISGLNCSHCAAGIEREASALPGVLSVRMDGALNGMLLEMRPGAAVGPAVEKINALAAEIEPGARVTLPGREETAHGRNAWTARGARAAAGFLLLVLSAALPVSGTAKAALSLLAWLLSGYDVLFLMLRNIRRGRFFDENLLMSAATVGAVAIGDYAEAAGVMIFYQFGRLLEGLAAGRAKKSIAGLTDLRPDSANLLGEDGSLSSVPAQRVPAGSFILVRPGERIPLDGVVENGASGVDTAMLTGESLPRAVSPGDPVLAGFVNGNGALTVRTTKTSGGSAAARVLEMVSSAAARKAKTEAFITRFSRVYTPVVLSAALLVALLPPLLVPGARFPDYLYRALVFLVVSCPCALVVSVPLGFLAGMGGTARAGVLFKGGAALEKLSRARAAVFDKTGTLTTGNFSVVRVLPVFGVSPRTLLERAACAEKRSSHPLAAAVLAACGGGAPDAESYEELPGRGMRAGGEGFLLLAGNRKLLEENGAALPEGADGPNGRAVLHVAENGRYLGRLELADSPRPGARKALNDLRGLGFSFLAVLTGDTGASAESALRGLDFDVLRAGLLPDGKLASLEEFMAESKTPVVFVGDGINDAPALARADVGVAMGAAGADAAIEAADAVVMTGDPEKLADAVRCARRTMRIVRENIALALAFKAAVLLLGAFGLASMWEAAFADSGVALLCIMNSLRALRR